MLYSAGCSTKEWATCFLPKAEVKSKIGVTTTETILGIEIEPDAGVVVGNVVQAMHIGCGIMAGLKGSEQSFLADTVTPAYGAKP
ncbi:hypothetical protein HC752_15625 [Vibrio sp. S9_S30]|uniref:hypothetical protein n=1 Tax=Vibrio sp. S9_S30 TaxID=2720226 RepID=UPI001681A14C|nr:hypothetical protein [Vibrio sp. S9_S30]MBD1558368.1 hypothetical protein [Vibrio sp. S9_S30]